eukprot:8166601-Pyramimonas_sp.AAC.1
MLTMMMWETLRRTDDYQSFYTLLRAYPFSLRGRMAVVQYSAQSASPLVAAAMRALSSVYSARWR